MALEDDSDPPSMVHAADRDYRAALVAARAALSEAAPRAHFPGFAYEPGKLEPGTYTWDGTKWTGPAPEGRKP
jgi:hypothetical protein